MNYLSSFRKGWTSTQNWRRFAQGLAEGDCHAIASAVHAENPERLPVDAYILALPTPDASVLRNAPEPSEIGSEEFDREQMGVHDLAVLRDDKLMDLPSTLDPGLRKLSFFLRDIEVQKREPGKDFMVHDRTWSEVQAGRVPRESVNVVGRGPIETGRDLATYVHDDSPIEQWNRVVAALLRANVPQRLPPTLHDSDGSGQSRFACWGAPYLSGIIGAVVQRTGVVSFQSKWKGMVPRPEEYAMMAGLGFLPQAYPEGSPMHPSRRAMHSFAALACAAAVLELFDGSTKLPGAEGTVAEEVNLFAENIGLARLWSGVHRMSDHTSSAKPATDLGQKVVGEFLRR